MRLRAAVLGAALLALAARPAAPRCAPARSAPRPSGREVSYVVDLPPSYDGSGDRKYPVVYALHGLFEGSGFWERRGLAPILAGLRESGAVPEFLVVAVDGGNSFFVNAPGGRYEDLVTKDLVAHVESAYRVVPGRKGRALLGVSMGGYAALHIAFEAAGARRPRSPPTARCSWSAIPSADQGAGRWHMAAFNKVFGDPIDAALWAENDPLAWARQGGPEVSPRPLRGLRRRGPIRPRQRPPRRCTGSSTSAGSPTPSSCPRATTATSSFAPGSRRACASSATP